MPLRFNFRHLEKKDLVLNGELPAAELELNGLDECIHVTLPIKHELRVQLVKDGILVEGRLQTTLDCECVHCLKSFRQRLDWPAWKCFLPLEGEDKVAVSNDFVDLTSCIREDILLAFPQQPLCEPGCNRLPKGPTRGVKIRPDSAPVQASSSVWADLSKLKF
jgi:uncharacterized metal-binding protein YceD (DUF177 family)